MKDREKKTMKDIGKETIKDREIERKRQTKMTDEACRGKGGLIKSATSANLN